MDPAAEFVRQRRSLAGCHWTFRMIGVLVQVAIQIVQNEPIRRSKRTSMRIPPADYFVRTTVGSAGGLSRTAVGGAGSSFLVCLLSFLPTAAAEASNSWFIAARADNGVVRVLRASGAKGQALR